METTNIAQFEKDIAICTVAIAIVESLQYVSSIRRPKRMRSTDIAATINDLVGSDVIFINATAFEHGIYMLQEILSAKPFSWSIVKDRIKTLKI